MEPVDVYNTMMLIVFAVAFGIVGVAKLVAMFIEDRRNKEAAKRRTQTGSSGWHGQVSGIRSYAPSTTRTTSSGSTNNSLIASAASGTVTSGDTGSASCSDSSSTTSCDG